MSVSKRCGVVPRSLRSFDVDLRNCARCSNVRLFEVWGGDGKTMESVTGEDRGVMDVIVVVVKDLI